MTLIHFCPRFGKRNKRTIGIPLGNGLNLPLIRIGIVIKKLRNPLMDRLFIRRILDDQIFDGLHLGARMEKSCLELGLAAWFVHVFR